MTRDNISPSIEDEIDNVFIDRPHLVILGAGASRAAFPKGDRNGKKLPLMADLVDTLNLRSLLESWSINPNRDFETIFSEIHAAGAFEKSQILEEKIDEYFSSLQIGGEPTIYDHLILSLRKTDVIATFNWDPLLLQAARRTVGQGLPRLLFLHGNVAAGYCSQDKIAGPVSQHCSKCHEPFTRTPLLYPITQKDYAANEHIAADWEYLKKVLSDAFMITVFGYSGPKSDEEALNLMGTAWGGAENRSMEQACFITLQNEDEVMNNFGRFIHTHHYEIHDDFYSSWIAQHPRRTGEAWWNQYYESKFLPDNPIPKDADFYDLQQWFRAFRLAEQEFDLEKSENVVSHL